MVQVLKEIEKLMPLLFFSLSNAAIPLLLFLNSGKGACLKQCQHRRKQQNNIADCRCISDLSMQIGRAHV